MRHTGKNRSEARFLSGIPMPACKFYKIQLYSILRNQVFQKDALAQESFEISFLLHDFFAKGIPDIEFARPHSIPE
jgi:hypothetical protein